MNQIKTVGLLGLLTGLLVAISYGIGGTSGAILGLGLAAIMNLGSWYFSDKIALSAYGAQPITRSQAPQLYGIVEQLAQRSNIPMPSVYMIPSPAANAFATGRDPEHAAVAVTEGIVNFLSADELAGVIAHELSHIRNRDTLTQAVAATIGGAIATLAQILSYSLYFLPFNVGDRDERGGANIFTLLLTVTVAPIAATIIQLGISRTREFAADAGAAELTGNPRALASALRRLEQAGRRLPIVGHPAFEPLLIVNALAGKMPLSSLFSTHPSTETRIAKLLELEQRLVAVGRSTNVFDQLSY